MDCGFETIGNATLICHDGGPVLVTDPWISGDAYFGSWSLSHEIPAEQIENINACDFIWLSHGHPDHLSVQSLRLLKSKKILIPDHVGGRIADDLRGLKFDVTILKDRIWTSLSPRIRVLSIADYNQDGILLVDIDGVLVMDLNDTSPRGWGRFVRKIAGQYDVSFLLQISGYGDNDMINYIDDTGDRIEPRAALKLPVGPSLARVAEGLGAKFVVPFSSLHKYQRSDSVWANQYTTPLDAYSEGFQSKKAEILPAFIKYDCQRERFEEINPPETPEFVCEPEQFGDNWSEQLDAGDLDKIKSYFQKIYHLGQVLDFINLRVGGQDNFVELRTKNFQKGVTFEVPRNSLMKCVRYRIFDDLLIGNFMRTSLVGTWPDSKLYPDFTPYVAKYSDNGLAASREELDRYFQQYQSRAPMEYLRHQLQNSVASVVRGHLDSKSPIYQTAQKLWWLSMGRRLS